jgi:rare lipoprotein A
MYVAAAPPALAALPQGSLGADTATAALAAASAPLSTRLSISSQELQVLAGHEATVRGTLLAGRRGAPGQEIWLQALRPGGWSTLTRARTGAGGRFVMRYFPRRIGSRRVRMRFSGTAELRGVRRPLGRLDVYRPVEVSWYGGGGGLACGGSLTGATMGVASRTLPCGTLVTLRFAGRSVRVPVVDRGPYVDGREFDLTEATKQALRFGDTGTLWSTS